MRISKEIARKFIVDDIFYEVKTDILSKLCIIEWEASNEIQLSK